MIETITMFHWFNGWYFGRNPDGSVKIEKRSSAKPDSPLVVVASIPIEDWASIVASVSQHGDDTIAWKRALEFHGDPDKNESL